MKYVIICLVSGFLFSACNQPEKRETAGKNMITPEMAESMKATMKKELIGSDIQKTNDLDKYCACIVSDLQTEFTSTEIMEAEFTDSKKYKKSKTKCLESTKLK